MAPDWIQALGRHNRGSRPRCIVLVDGSREAVSAQLTKLVDLPDVTVRPEDLWMPVGKPVKQGSRWDDTCAKEARLDRDAGFISDRARAMLKEWWLSVPRGANTPNWDLASTCAVEDRQGLLLVEAKAHEKELSAAGKSLPSTGNGWKNHERIGLAISESSSELQRECGGSWSLSRDDRYQLSNRFAWSWKIAALGTPVVLVYLGFLDADDMHRDGPLFQTHDDWVNAVRQHAVGAVDESCWGSRLQIQNVPLFPLIRSRKVSLPAG